MRIKCIHTGKLLGTVSLHSGLSIWTMCHAVCACSVVSFSVTPWTEARQAPLSMEFSRQEYWSGLPFSPLVDLPNPGFEPESLESPALTGDSLPLPHMGQGVS